MNTMRVRIAKCLMCEGTGEVKDTIDNRYGEVDEVTFICLCCGGSGKEIYELQTCSLGHREWRIARGDCPICLSNRVSKLIKEMQGS